MVPFTTIIAGSMPLVSLLPFVQGHMAMWDPSVYGYIGGKDSIYNPLAGLPLDQWVSARYPVCQQRG
jgi:hypothetical protein